MEGLDSKKRIGLIASYYLSRCDKKQLKRWGTEILRKHLPA